MHVKPGNANLLIGVFTCWGPFIRSNSFIISAYGEISAPCTISVQLDPRKSFRINIFETDTKQRALTSFGMNTFAKPQGGTPGPAEHRWFHDVHVIPRLSETRSDLSAIPSKFPQAHQTVAPFTRLCDKGGFVHEIALEFLATRRNCGQRLLRPEFSRCRSGRPDTSNSPFGTVGGTTRSCRTRFRPVHSRTPCSRSTGYAADGHSASSPCRRSNSTRASNPA
jgi:hypothetical protein